MKPSFVMIAPARIAAACLAVLCMALGSAQSVAAPAPAMQAAAHTNAYALVVGSNPGGQGQDTLRYAENDARHMARLLSEVGGYHAGRVHLMLRPTPAELLAALDALRLELERDAAQGRQTRFFFYYSGHARARAFNLGTSELALEEVRQKILELPATLTIVVLDACQSGAFSRVKGAEPTADFSFNSVTRLNARGVAVMASSSGTELSQESQRLGSSYFTHHLLVALRGAGDRNRDGRVSLDEAYEYAYQRTLLSTAVTAVGSQHVTLETELKGKGDVALSYPARAGAHLNLSPSLEADILVMAEPQGVVVAELHKSKGAPLRLALPGGYYSVLVRTTSGARKCLLSLRDSGVTGLEHGHCENIRLQQDTAKGQDAQLASSRWSRAHQNIAVELSGGLHIPLKDTYTDRLTDFGFGDQLFLRPRLRLSASYDLHKHIQIVADFSNLDTGHYRRNNREGAHEFYWSTTGLGLYLRGSLPSKNGVAVPFVQAGAGVARARTDYEKNDPVNRVETDIYWGYHMGVAGGLLLMPWRRLGVLTRVGYDYAPIIENLVGDTHDSGGSSLEIGIRARF